jgi:uncharacterized membrane protein
VIAEKRNLNLDRVAFALALIGLGLVSLVYGDFALQWQPVPAWVPARRALAYLSGVILLGTGGALITRRAALASSRVFLGYAFLWLVLKLPALFAAPLVEGNWLGAGEIAVIFAAACVLYGSSRSLVAQPNGGSRFVKYLFGVALIPIGLSHFFYLTVTTGFVPAWLPFRAFWAYLSGAGHVAAGLAVLLGIVPRLAALLEAAMIGVFTALVWLPGVIATPRDRLQWTAFFVSWLIGAAAWVVGTGLPTDRRPADHGDEPTSSAPVRAPEDFEVTRRGSDPVVR